MPQKPLESYHNFVKKTLLRVSGHLYLRSIPVSIVHLKKKGNQVSQAFGIMAKLLKKLFSTVSGTLKLTEVQKTTLSAYLNVYYLVKTAV